MASESAALGARLPRNGVMQNIGYLVGGQLTTWMLAALWTIVVPRQIGPIGMGQLVTVWSVTGILSIIVGLGTQVLVVTDIARNPVSAGRIASAAIMARLLLYIPGVGLMAIYLHYSRFDQYEMWLLIIGTLSMPLNLVSEVLASALQGLERMQYIAYASVVFRAASTAGGIVLVLLGFRVLGLVILGSTAAALALATNFYWARHHFDLVWSVDLKEIKRVIVSSLPFWATTIINTVYLWIDSVMLAFLASPAEVGWYGVPTKFFASFLFIPVIVSTATLARLTATFAEGHDSFKRTLTPILESILVISLPLAAGTAELAGPVINLLFGPAYVASAPVLTILALAVPATYLNIVVNQSLVASNRQMVWTKVMAVSVVINVLLNLVAIPAFRDGWHNGALGAAWSLLGTELMMALVGLYLVRDSLDSATLGRVARAAVASLTMGLVVNMAAPLGLAVQVGMGLLIFGVLAVLLRLFRPSELALAGSYARTLQTRVAGMLAR